jgi:hypothetical protein
LYDWKWSDVEKKLVRRVYEEARLAELAETLDEFKVRAAALASIDDMWLLEEYLRNRRRELHEKYDYRYSRLGRTGETRAVGRSLRGEAQ